MCNENQLIALSLHIYSLKLRPSKASYDYKNKMTEQNVALLLAT